LSAAKLPAANPVCKNRSRQIGGSDSIKDLNAC
jgi:hypothetical protein